MSLSSDSAVLTMPVQPANTNGGNGFGFGNDGAWWIIILFLFAFCGSRSGSLRLLMADFAALEKRSHSAGVNRCRQAAFAQWKRKVDRHALLTATLAGLCFGGGSAHDRTHRPSNGSAYHGPANAALGFGHRQIVRRIRFVPCDFIKTVNHAWAFITTAVSKVKQPVDLIDRDKECIAVKDGIGLFKCSAAAVQCNPVVRKGGC